MKLLHGARRPVMGSALVLVGYEAGMGMACDSRNGVNRGMMLNP